jgi:phosphatidate cytidylyltransferase
MLLVAGFGISNGPSAVPVAAMALLAVSTLTLAATPRTLGWLGAVTLAALWIGLPAAALLELSAGENGGRVLLFLLAAVMIGEAGAFVGGKLIGGPRLAPSLSPGKTWAGFVAQLVFGGAAGAAAVPLLSPELGPLPGAALGGWISAAAALGDLFESFWKRAAGRKDSGRIIPGHGGLLDRIDGVLFGALALLAASVALPF